MAADTRPQRGLSLIYDCGDGSSECGYCKGSVGGQSQSHGERAWGPGPCTPPSQASCWGKGVCSARHTRLRRLCGACGARAAARGMRPLAHRPQMPARRAAPRRRARLCLNARHAPAGMQAYRLTVYDYQGR
mgnify:CR=1 FL=1